MPQRKRPLSEAPKDGTPFLAYYNAEYPCVAVFDWMRGKFIIPERDGFMELSTYATWVPLTEVVEE
jgi:hypothetical protein